MKTLFLFGLYLFFSTSGHAQNVGIGTVAPLFKLDVKNGSINTDSAYRIGNYTVLATELFGNLYLGQEAGIDNQGYYNTFTGYRAGYANISGIENSFFGAESGVANLGGNYNSFFGRYSGFSNDTGSKNSFFGRSTGYSNTAGIDNSFFGFACGVYNTMGDNNSFFGSGAGYANTTGDDNSFYGKSAGSSNTTGFFNSFYGHNAGLLNNTGYSNSFFGQTAGYSNNTGFYNSFFGAGSGYSNTYGENNSFYGEQSGYFNTYGDDNSFFGKNAGYFNTGYNNSFFGEKSGYNNTSGDGNAFFGKSSGVTNNTGFYNSFFGASSGFLNTTGDNNSFFGEEAGFFNSTANDNSFFGKDAGYFNETGGSNSFFGKNAGYHSETGTLNTALGYNTNIGIVLMNATALGANAKADCSNCMVLGSVTGYNGATSGVNVGIGINNPNATLHVTRGTGGYGTAAFHGTSYISHFNFDVSENTYIRAGKDNGFVIINDISGGKVGIGTGTPTEMLSVFGNICATGTIGVCSDIRYKTNLSPLTNSLNNILNLQGLHYFWKKDGFEEKSFSDKRQIGFSAQELEILYPEIVMTDDQGFKSVDYSRLTPVLVEAIKEQQQQINDLQNQIAELKMLIEKIDNKIR